MGNSKLFAVFIVFSLVYLGLTFGIPPNPESLAKYNLTANQAKLLQLTISLPFVAIWLTAFYGYSKFNNYARTVKDSKEGEAWGNIVKGLLTLVFWLPINSIASIMTSYVYQNNPGNIEPAIILSNYLNLILVLLAFYYFYQGGMGLVKSIDKTEPARLVKWALIALAPAGGLFIYLAISSTNKTVAVDATTPAAYYLPDWLLVLTIIIPYIFTFYLGFRAVQSIFFYQKNVKGYIYKRSLNFLAAGISFVITSLIVLRYVASLPTIFSESTLQAILLIIYLLVILIGAGYIMIALGAKRMQKLEEV